MTITGDLWSRLADRLEGEVRTVRDAATPGELACLLDPRTVQTPALELIDQRLVQIYKTPDGRMIVTIAPQEGKSTRISHYCPLWLFQRNPDLRLGLASYEATIARRWGRAVRNTIKSHPGLGLTVRDDTSAAHEWALDGVHDEHCPCDGCLHDDRAYVGGMITVGLGGALTGRPLDGLIIDDPVKDRAQANSEAYREYAWGWWTDVARTRLSPGAFAILVQTRWHEDDLAGRLQTTDVDSWDVLNIPTRADHRPEKGETDPLGRDPGVYMTSARGPDRVTQWQAIETGTPSTWASLYQGRPAPAEGVLLKRDLWQTYTAPRFELRDGGVNWILGNPDETCQSWDMAFKNTKASDYVVCQVWARWGLDAYLLWQLRARLSFTATVDAMRRTAREWPQVRLKLVEDKANGTAVIDQLQNEITGLVPVEVTDGKYARAVAVSPFVESRHVFLPDPAMAPWVEGFIDECAVFPNSANDDQVDGFTQAVERLLGHPTRTERTRPPEKVDLGRGIAGAFGGAQLPGGARPWR